MALAGRPGEARKAEPGRWRRAAARAV